MGLDPKVAPPVELGAAADAAPDVGIWLLVVMAVSDILRVESVTGLDEIL